jgi:hypothetical protein
MTLFELIRARRAESRHGIITMNADQTALTLRLPSFVSSVTRSRIIARSNSAKTPIIWNMARPLGVRCPALALVQIEVNLLGMQFGQQLQQARE